MLCASGRYPLISPIERLKCFFTTWAYEYRIGKDQDECESLLKRIYENAEVAGFMDYEEFKEYMLQFVK